MARSLYERAAARGFPVFNASGQTGQGALADSTAPPARAGLPAAAWADPNTDPGSVGAALPLPQEYQLGAGLWGLPAGANPDDGVYGPHGVPMADPTADEASYIAEATGAHGPVFNSAAIRHHPGTLEHMDQGRQGGQGSSAAIQVPLPPPMRALGGFDAVQGYGGGGPGPGGVNEPQGPATDLMTFGGHAFTADSFVSAGEVPFLSVSADQFIASAPELPPYAPAYDVPTANVSAQAVVAVDTPALGPSLSPGAPGVYVPGFWG